MVRDFDGRIVHWAAGAERLYGWSAQEAIGRISHKLLATEFPKPRAEIEAALLAECGTIFRLILLRETHDRTRLDSHPAA
jgi:PAS domain-containing protein